MQEIDLGQLGIRVEAVQHLHGSPYGQYWGYVVVQNGEKFSTYFGKSKKSSEKRCCDPFTSRVRALRFAKSLAGDKDQTAEELDEACEFEHLWIDTGGEA